MEIVTNIWDLQKAPKSQDVQKVGQHIIIQENIGSSGYTTIPLEFYDNIMKVYIDNGGVLIVELPNVESKEVRQMIGSEMLLKEVSVQVKKRINKWVSTNKSDWYEYNAVEFEIDQCQNGLIAYLEGKQEELKPNLNEAIDMELLLNYSLQQQDLVDRCMDIMERLGFVALGYLLEFVQELDEAQNGEVGINE